MRIPKWLKRIGKDLRSGENLDLYLLFIAAIVVSLGSLLDVLDSDQVASTTVAILALLSVSILILRHQMVDFVDVVNRQSNTVDALPADFGDRIAGAREVYLCGSVLVGLLVAFGPDFQMLLRSGGKLRVLLMDPRRENLLHYVNDRFNRPNDEVSDFRTVVERTVDEWTQFAEESRGDAEVRLVATAPSARYYIVDPGTRRELAFVRFYSYRPPGGDYNWNKMWVNMDHLDPLLAQSMRDELDRMWRDGRPIASGPTLGR